MDTPLEDTLRGWITARRDHGGVIFCDIRGTKWTTQAMLHSGTLSDDELATVRHLPIESGIEFTGVYGPANKTGSHDFEVTAIIATYPANNRTGALAKIDDRSKLMGEVVDRYLTNRHITVRTEFSRAALTARSRVHRFLMDWLTENGYIEIHAPILTRLPLYDDGSAVALSVHDQAMFLTQCVGFYLEAASHSLSRVFNIGPSFRAEDSKSTRHLVEYWHVKLESTWSTREDLMSMAEALLLAAQEFVQKECADLIPYLGGGTTTATITAPFRRMTYRQVLVELAERGVVVEFGGHIGSLEEEALADLLQEPLWIVGNPRIAEPFPYRIDPDDDQVTVTADLLLPGGYGELLGIAEKIISDTELLRRMEEKRKDPKGPHSWMVDLRRSGCVPHAGLGMGFERLLRWLFQTTHVRDFSAFPRIFGRDYWP